jgi:hypothetical protein
MLLFLVHTVLVFFTYRYELLRNGQVIHNTTNTSATAFLDTSLTPDTTYTYAIVAHTSGGYTQSADASATTYVKSHLAKNVSFVSFAPF